jgi:hypothetical protein
LIFVSQAKLPVPLFSYRLFEVKSLDCFSTVASGRAAGVLPRICKEPYSSDLSLLI